MEEFAEKCGITGIYSLKNDYPAARMLHEAQLYLEHRGQHSHGIVTYDGSMYTASQMGHVTHDFSPAQYASLKGNTGIGHNRYKTAGLDGENDCQPFIIDAPFGQFALAHNGTIFNAPALAKRLKDEGVPFKTGRDGDIHTINDSEVIGRLIAQERDIVTGIKYASTQLQGAYSMAILDSKGELYGVRDPRGIKPLCRGKGDGVTGIFSESCVFDSDLLEMEWAGNIQPGEIYHVGGDGEEHIDLPDKGKVRPALDIFELVYFANPASVIDDISVQLFRYYGGRALGKKNVHTDKGYRTVPVEYSGNSWAQGFAQETDQHIVAWFYRNRYAGRSFIGATDEERRKIARQKLIIIESAVREFPNGLLIEDSIVRGTTMKSIIRRLRRAGAKEIHPYIGYPEVIDICPWGGIDLKTQDEHLANQYPDRQERMQFLGADSLTYNTPEDLIWAANQARVGTAKGGSELLLDHFCTHCITRKNPFETTKTL